MDKNVLLFFVALMAVAMLTTPVMAETLKKIPIMIVALGFSGSAGETRMTEGSTYHARGGYVESASYMLTGDGISLSGYSYSDPISSNMNLKTSTGNKHYDSTILFQGGTFEGHGTEKGTCIIRPNGAVRVTDGVIHFVWHGTGAYQGWTLVRRHAIPLPPGQPHGYLLIP